MEREKETPMAKELNDKNNVPRWPAIEEQLARDKVTPGSALEKLIRENQDFHMLRPEEAHDKLRLPPWLRVYWRKKHPDAVYKGPSGGYPLLLMQIYKWMLLHHDLPTQQGPESSKGGHNAR
jgi:hypothetical protein